MIIPYTDRDGTVHIRDLGTGNTLCGVDARVATEARPVKPCGACVTESTAQYARQEAQRLCGGFRDPGQLS